MLEIISVGPGDAALLTDDAKQAIARADAVWCAARHAVLMPPEKVRPLSPLEDAIEQMRVSSNAGQNAAVLVSGDAGLYSLLEMLKRKIGGEYLRVHPGVSALQLFAARLGVSWQNARILSAFPNLRFLNIEAVQIQRVRHAGNRRVRFPDGQRQQAFFALFAPVVAQLNRDRVNAVRRLASVGQNAVPDQLSAPRVHLRRAQIDGFAFRAAQLHRQRAALRCLKGNRPSFSGVQALAVRRHIRQLRRGLRTGRRHQQQKNHP